MTKGTWGACRESGCRTSLPSKSCCFDSRNKRLQYVRALGNRGTSRDFIVRSLVDSSLHIDQKKCSSTFSSSYSPHPSSFYYSSFYSYPYFCYYSYLIISPFHTLPILLSPIWSRCSCLRAVEKGTLNGETKRQIRACSKVECVHQAKARQACSLLLPFLAWWSPVFACALSNLQISLLGLMVRRVCVRPIPFVAFYSWLDGSTCLCAPHPLIWFLFLVRWFPVLVCAPSPRLFFSSSFDCSLCLCARPIPFAGFSSWFDGSPC